MEGSPTPKGHHGTMRMNMNAIKVDTTIDEAVALAIPALRPLLGRHVEIIALDAAPARTPERKLTLDELVASRIRLPHGIAPLFAGGIDAPSTATKDCIE
jgi:hypothetical protein